MAESKKDKVKYSILKVIDLSGFKVFDPPVRLLFGEDPQRQLRDIGKFMLLPILFVGLCLLSWHIIAPTHKTKSGAVPTPGKILSAYNENDRFDERAEEKIRAFELTGKERDEEVTIVTTRLGELEEEAERLSNISKEVAAKAKKEMAALTEPLDKNLTELTAKYKETQILRKGEMTVLGDKLVAGEVSSEELIALVESDKKQTEIERDQLKDLRTQLDEIRADPPSDLKDSQLAANKVADEVQHHKKLLAILTAENRELKKEALLAKVSENKAALASATTGKEAVMKAKAIVSNEERATKVDEQKYPPTATIFWQTKRSLATVFVGFLIATCIAIPVGIMCGLNQVVMACLTPIISIFRPVSPVVWLLIFQIIVGAFFPDPEKHALFVTLNAEAWFGWIPNPIAFLKTNPAMVFSACTVAVCALWPALVNTALGVSAIDKDHLNVARVLKLGFWSRLFKIVIPSSLPLVFAGLRISLGVGWMVLIAAEALSSSDGLGKFVWDEYQNGSSQSFANIILACFIVGIIGFFLDRIMVILQRLVSFDDGSATA
ncbi:ABC transporter permease subunit [Akkermansiaceae bacterium]|nr:ABC transporter permease subunit [Akkermansiaceae bacterium]